MLKILLALAYYPISKPISHFQVFVTGKAHFLVPKSILLSYVCLASHHKSRGVHSSRDKKSVISYTRLKSRCELGHGHSRGHKENSFLGPFQVLMTAGIPGQSVSTFTLPSPLKCQILVCLSHLQILS